MTAKAITPLAVSTAQAAFDVIQDAVPIGFTKKAIDARIAHREAVANRNSLPFVDRVDLARRLRPISRWLRSQVNARSAVNAAAKDACGCIAEAHGTNPSELVALVRQNTRSIVRKATVTEGEPANTSLLTPDGLKSYHSIMNMVGQWRAKRAVAGMMQHAQFLKMVGEDVRDRGTMHVSITGFSGTGTSRILEDLAPIARDLGLTKSPKAKIVAASSFFGVNSGDTDKNVQGHFEAGKDGIVGIEGVQALAAGGGGGWQDVIYGALSQRLKDRAYHDTLVAIAGPPLEMARFMAKDSAFPSSFGNHIELVPMTTAEMMQLFMISAAASRLAGD